MEILDNLKSNTEGMSDNNKQCLTHAIDPMVQIDLHYDWRTINLDMVKAIKFYRKVTGMSLVACKAIVDHFKANPPINRQYFFVRKSEVYTLEQYLMDGALLEVQELPSTRVPQWED